MPPVKITDPTYGDFEMPWNSSEPPKDSDIDLFIQANNLKPKSSSLTVKKPSFAEGMNEPVLPEKDFGGINSTISKPETIEPYYKRAAREIGQDAYDKIARPLSTPLALSASVVGGIGSGLTKLGVPLVKPALQTGMALTASSQVPEALKSVSKAYSEPNINSISDATLKVASPLLLGIGAKKVGEINASPKTNSSAVPNSVPNEAVNTSPKLVEIPKDVVFKLKPGLEDAVVEKDGKLFIQDLDKFKQGVGELKGPDFAVKKLAKSIRAAKPSTDYNEGYNPDAEVTSQITEQKPTENAFRDWVNGRSAAKFTGQNAKNNWAKLDETYGSDFEPAVNKGEEIGDAFKGDNKHPLVKLQEALKNNEEPELTRYLNQLHEEARSAGVNEKQLQLGYKQNYLSQIWEDSPEEISNAFKETKRLGTRPGFFLPSIIADYQAGIDKGLTPKFSSPSDLISSYAKYVDKFVSDKNFFDQLRVNGQLKTRQQIPSSEFGNWEALDPKRTPVISYQDEKGNTITKEYYAPKDVAKNINNYLSNEGNDLQDLSGMFGKTKSLAMTTGVPGTAINPHGFNVLGRVGAFTPNLVGKYLREAINPELASASIRDSMQDAPRFVRAGLKFTPELEPKEGSGFEVGRHNLMERPLFGQVVPSIQLEMAKQFEQQFLKDGVEPKTAVRQASLAANDAAGRINFEEMGRSKAFQSLSHAINFAPTWLESQYNIAKGAFTDSPRAQVYRDASKNVLKAYALMEANNYMRGAAKDRPFEMYLGKDDKNKEVWIAPFGNGDDFLKLPFQLAIAAKEGKGFEQLGNDVKNRLNTPIQFAVDFLSGKNYRGQDMWKEGRKDLPVLMPDSKGRSKSEEVLTDAAHRMLPRWIPDSMDLIRGKKDASLEQVGADLTSAPFRFRTPAK